MLAQPFAKTQLLTFFCLLGFMETGCSSCRFSVSVALWSYIETSEPTRVNIGIDTILWESVSYPYTQEVLLDQVRLVDYVLFPLTL